MTVTIGGGLALGTVSVLFFFIRRSILRRRAAKDFEQFLASRSVNVAPGEQYESFASITEKPFSEE